MLGAARDLRGDVELVELGVEDLAGLLDVLLAVAASLGHHELDLLVLARREGLEGLILELLYHRQWHLLTFAGISLLAGFVFQLQVAGAVRLAVDDPELRARYGSR